MNRADWELLKRQMYAEDLAAVAGDLRTLRETLETLRETLVSQPKPSLISRLLGR